MKRQSESSREFSRSMRLETQSTSLEGERTSADKTTQATAMQEELRPVLAREEATMTTREASRISNPMEEVTSDRTKATIDLDNSQTIATTADLSKISNSRSTSTFKERRLITTTLRVTFSRTTKDSWQLPTTVRHQTS